MNITFMYVNYLLLGHCNAKNHVLLQNCTICLPTKVKFWKLVRFWTFLAPTQFGQKIGHQKIFSLGLGQYWSENFGKMTPLVWSEGQRVRDGKTATRRRCYPQMVRCCCAGAFEGRNSSIVKDFCSRGEQSWFWTRSTPSDATAVKCIYAEAPSNNSD